MCIGIFKSPVEETAAYEQDSCLANKMLWLVDI